MAPTKEAQDYDQARKAACAISTSSLVKTAMFGKDANWGRIVCALGYSGAQFKPENVHLWMSSSMSCRSVAGGLKRDLRNRTLA